MITGIESQISVNENRKEIVAPSLSEIRSKDFIPRMDEYLKNNFPLRPYLLYIEWYLSRILKSPTSNKVLIGKDGWLFYRGEKNLEDYQNSNILTRAEIQKWVHYVKVQRLKAEKIGAKFIFMIAPNAHTIYGDLYLPEWVSKKNKVSRTDQLKEALKKEGIDLVDPRSALLKRRLNENLYHKTDTHWTSLGAYYGTQELLKRLNLKLSDLSEYNLRKETKEHLDLALMLGPVPMKEDVITLIPKNGPKAKIIETQIPNSQPRIDSKCETCGNLRAVIYRDSFMTAMVPFISENFKSVKYIWKRSLNWDVIAKEKPDYVIQEIVERALMKPI